MKPAVRDYLAAHNLGGAAFLYENHAHIATVTGGLNFEELSICALVAQCERSGSLRPEQLAFIADKLTAALAARNPMPVIPAPAAPQTPQTPDNGNGGAMVKAPVGPKRKPPGGARVYNPGDVRLVQNADGSRAWIPISDAFAH